MDGSDGAAAGGQRRPAGEHRHRLDIHISTAADVPAIEQMDASITEYDGIRTRQLISTIKALDKETLLIRFKDGTEVTQKVEK